MELDRYEVAFLCGGPSRVALTAVVTMHRDGRIKISPARHRVQAATDEAGHPVERAVLYAAAWPGMGLRFVLDDVAGSAAAGAAGEGLRRRGLLGRHGHLTAAGRALREELRGAAPASLRVAVLGADGVEEDLREVLDAPDAPSGTELIPKQRRDKKYGHADDETPIDTSIAGYPGIPGHW